MNDKTLHRQLTTMVGNFGYDNVRKTLGDIRREKSHTTKPKKMVIKLTTNTPARKKINAAAVVISFKLTDSKKHDSLLALAKKYDKKLFMPNVTHVRSFLMHEHEDPSRIKSRQQVTVKVFKKLAEMSLEELHEIEFCGFYDPPKRLAIYAETIANFGRSIRGSR